MLGYLGIIITLVLVGMLGIVAYMPYMPELMLFYDLHIRKKNKPVDPDRPVYRNDIPQKILDTKNPDIIAIYCLLAGDPEFDVAPITLDECKPLFAEHLIDEYIAIRDESHPLISQFQHSHSLYNKAISALQVASTSQQQLQQQHGIDPLSDTDIVDIARSSYYRDQDDVNGFKHLRPLLRNQQRNRHQQREAIQEAMKKTAKDLLRKRGY